MLRSVLKDILSKAKEEEKTKVIIGAHSNIWQFGISKLGNMGEVVCGDTKGWKQFESNKVANGAVTQYAHYFTTKWLKINEFKLSIYTVSIIKKDDMNSVQKMIIKR